MHLLNYYNYHFNFIYNIKNYNVAFEQAVVFGHLCNWLFLFLFQEHWSSNRMWSREKERAEKDDRPSESLPFSNFVYFCHGAPGFA